MKTTTNRTIRGWSHPLLAGLAAAIALHAPGKEASAYKVMTASGTGVALRWTSLPMKFKMHNASLNGVSASEFVAAVRASYKTWSTPSVSCSYFSSSDQGAVSQSSPNSSDQVNSHIPLTSWSSTYGSNALGVTLTYYDPSSGKITDADTVYNPNYSWSATGSAYAIDVQSVATHEIGHQLGLDHSSTQSATMFYAVGQGNIAPRSLDSDDIQGLCHIYPTGTTPPPECTSASQCASNEVCTNNKCVSGSTGTKGYGSSCQDGGDCKTGLCLQYGSATFCSQQCDTQSCPNGDQCLSVSGGGSVTKACLPNSGTAATKTLGQGCSSSTECKSGICVSVTGKGYLCSQKCSLSPDNCPTSYVCVLSSPSPLCIPGQKTTTTKKKLGETCTANTDCVSNLCAQTTAGKACVQTCDKNKTGACPTGYTCTNVTGLSGTVCVKTSSGGTAKLGEGCEKNTDCVSGLCVSAGDRVFCSEDCDPNGSDICDGDTSLTCIPAGDDTYACAPTAENADGSGSGCAVGPATGEGPAPRGSRLLLLLFVLSLALLLGRSGRR